MKKNIFLILILNSILLNAKSEYEIGIGVLNAQIDGYIKVGDNYNYLNNPSINQENDDKRKSLNIKKSNNIFIKFKYKNNNIIIQNNLLFYKSSGTGIATYEKNNIDYVVNVENEETITMLDSKINYNFSLFNNKIDIQPGCGISGGKGIIDISYKDQRIDALSKDDIVVFPYLSFNTNINLTNNFFIGNEIRYFDISYGNYNYFSYNFFINYKIINKFNLDFGFKHQEVYGENGNTFVNMKGKGFYSNINYKF